MAFNRHRRLKRGGWLIPLTYAATAMVLGMTLPRLETRCFPGLISTVSAPSAMAICSAIASGMLALTGIVFSLTFLMIQFSATAYSPRLVLWVARDPVMAHALGMFVATFLYALTLLAWVDRDASGRVPLVSAWAVLGLLLASMGLFVALIERVGLLQVSRMLVFTGDEGRRAIRDMAAQGASLRQGTESLDLTGWTPGQTVTHVGRPAVLQSVEVEALVAFASREDAVFELAAAVGDTVMETTPILRVYKARHVLPEDALLQHLQLGEERTFEQDPKYAIRLVVDIAVKALSPAINDPTTAVQALDQIEDLLLRLGRLPLEDGTFHDRAGRARLRMPCPAWEDFLRLALDEICAYGADSVQVMRRMNALIRNLLGVLPATRHAALRHWDRRIQSSIARAFDNPEEQQEARVADRQGLGIGEEPALELSPSRTPASAAPEAHGPLHA